MKKILIIDDDPGILKVVTYRLMKMGYEVLVAVNGREGLEKAMGIKPDLILVDYFMPMLNGDEVCKHIKSEEATKNIPVILMTADTQQIQHKLLHATGADGVLLKPFEQQEFFAKIMKYIG